MGFTEDCFLTDEASSVGVNDAECRVVCVLFFFVFYVTFKFFGVTSVAFYVCCINAIVRIPKECEMSHGNDA